MTPVNPGILTNHVLPPQGAAPAPDQPVLTPRQQAFWGYIEDRTEDMDKRLDVLMDKCKEHEHKPIHHPCECLWNGLAIFWRCIVSVFTRSLERERNH
jgi:hypothetical protein